MKKTDMPAGLLCARLGFWSIIYLLLGYISLLLDDPLGRVALVWFPAGAAVSAFLSIERKHWLALYIVLFLSRTLLDVVMRHSLETSLVLSLISLSCDTGVAWCVRRFGHQRDMLRKVSVWLTATLALSVLAALLGTAWLSTQFSLPFFSTAEKWWAANVSGNIVATTVLTGMLWHHKEKRPAQAAWAVAGLLSVGISAALVFNMQPASADSVGLVYGLACIPILLTVAVPLVAGNQAGALSFLILCIVVIFYSWQQTGPFFIRGLFRGEPLMLAQGYLSGTAVLMIFIRLVLQMRGGEDNSAPADDGQAIAFRLAIDSGQIDWDPDTDSPLRSVVSALRSREALLMALSDEVRQQMVSRWAQVTTGADVESGFVFRLSLPDAEPCDIYERNLFCIPGNGGGFIVGYWSPAAGGFPFNAVGGG
ncbi:MASE1 domain-containing protein [Pluralibacter gergoviae]|uniref:MASE1 domain-containing protein n=1 Tax=Pluralibacter gergoviae TaxID=61647 RepID=UPI003EE215B3